MEVRKYYLIAFHITSCASNNGTVFRVGGIVTGNHITFMFVTSHFIFYLILLPKLSLRLPPRPKISFLVEMIEVLVALKPGLGMMSVLSPCLKDYRFSLGCGRWSSLKEARDGEGQTGSLSSESQRKRL